MELSNSNFKNFIIILQKKVGHIFQKTETPEKNYYIFLKERFSYISGNRDPENISYISRNGIFLYFRERKP